MKKSYYDLDNLKNLYLEDSYVIAIEINGSYIKFDILAVIIKGHELYSIPIEGEEYCYKNISLQFPELKSYKFLSNKVNPMVDIDGQIDIGNIDSFVFDNGKYILEGEWGIIEIESTSPKVLYR